MGEVALALAEVLGGIERALSVFGGGRADGGVDRGLAREKPAAGTLLDLGRPRPRARVDVWAQGLPTYCLGAEVGRGESRRLAFTSTSAAALLSRLAGWWGQPREEGAEIVAARGLQAPEAGGARRASFFLAGITLHRSRWRGGQCSVQEQVKDREAGDVTRRREGGRVEEPVWRELTSPHPQASARDGLDHEMRRGYTNVVDSSACGQ